MRLVPSAVLLAAAVSLPFGASIASDRDGRAPQAAIAYGDDSDSDSDRGHDDSDADSDSDRRGWRVR